MAGGSLFLCRPRYLEALGIDPEGLAPGQDLDEEALARLGLAAAAGEAESRALGLLARAEQGRYLLSAKLAKHELPRRAIALALDWLEGQGLLDDGRYAQAWLRSRLGGPGATPAKLLTGLRAKGIDEGVVKAALAEVFGAEERKEALAQAWEKALKKTAGDKDEARSLLRGLGFKSQEIREYLESLEA